MGRVNDTISNVNSAVRNILLLVLIGGAGYGGYKAYEIYNEPLEKLRQKQADLDKTLGELNKAKNDLSAQQKQIEQLGAELKEKIAEVDRLQVAMKLLNVRHRLARLTVLGQREVPSLSPVAPTSGTKSGPSRANLMTKIQFVEINDQGEPIGQAKQFDIVGDIVYVDYLTVTFEDKYIEQSDLDRSTSIALFQRIFGEHQQPAQGFQLDTVGTRPTAYARGNKMSDFEKKIWNDFWLIANDPQRAKALGIDALAGNAVSMRVEPHKTYEIELRSTGTMTIRPVEAKAPPRARAQNAG
ncbi:MAG TPA: hypothetical protein VHE81_16605 [Lacipirellulaceae bacterium]|nr:hypothetical protein [Lacipirellulaceae bacterium]